jgi:hypothetical protein
MELGCIFRLTINPQTKLFMVSTFHLLSCSGSHLTQCGLSHIPCNVNPLRVSVLKGTLGILDQLKVPHGLST